MEIEHLFKNFTSHYVTINSKDIPAKSSIISLFTSHYVTINSKVTITDRINLQLFTSHYVTINSGAVDEQTTVTDTLHPTM